MPGNVHAHIYGIKRFRISSRNHYDYVSVTISTELLLSVSNTQTLTNHENSSILEN